MALFSFFRRISKAGYWVALFSLLIRIAQFMTLPFLAVYLTREGILTPGQIGLVIGISSFIFSISGLFNGLYIDRHSQKAILIFSCILSGLCYFAFAVSLKWFLALLLVNGLLGWFRSLMDISVVTIMVANTNEEDLAYAYSARFIAVNLGLVFGPLLGAVMANQHSLIIFYIAGAAHIAIGIALVFHGNKFFAHKTEHITCHWLHDLHELYKNKVLLNIILINFVLWVVYSQIDSTIPQYITHTMKDPAIVVSMLMVANALICVFFQPLIASWAERFSLKYSGIIGCLLFTAAFIIIALIPSKSSLIFASGMMSLAELLTLPINNLMIIRTAPKHLVASSNGLNNLGLLGISIGPVIGGYGLQYIGNKYLFLAIAMLPIIALWRYLVLFSDKLR